MPKLTEEELAMLTDEEREGIEDDSLVDEGEESDDGADAGTSPEAAAAAEPEPENPADDDGEGDAGDDPEKTSPAPQDAQQQPAPAEQEKPAPQKPQSALPDWKAPEDAKSKLQELDTQLDELAAKFDEGELTAAELRAQSRDIEQQKRDLDRQLLKEELAQETQADLAQRAQDAWYNTTVPQFLERFPEYAAKPILMGALDQAVRALQAEQPDNQFDADILAKADAQIRAELGLPQRDGKAAPAPAAKTERELPPTLSGVPSADIDDIDGSSEFAAIDRLEGVDYENALARMPDEMRERYLAR